MSNFGVLLDGLTTIRGMYRVLASDPALTLRQLSVPSLASKTVLSL